MFSATYDNYLILRNNVVGSTGGSLGIRLRASGSDASGSNYNRQNVTIITTTTTPSLSSSQTSWGRVLGDYTDSTDYTDGQLRICNPFSAKPTSIMSDIQIDNSSPYIYLHSGNHSLSTSYDGFTVIASSGNITGSISVYGYNK